MAPAEIKRFVDRFGWNALLDTESVEYANAGLKYMKVADAELAARIEREPKLLKLPLVRAGNQLSIGRDEAGWKTMLSDA